MAVMESPAKLPSPIRGVLNLVVRYPAFARLKERKRTAQKQSRMTTGGAKVEQERDSTLN